MNRTMYKTGKYIFTGGRGWYHLCGRQTNVELAIATLKNMFII